MSALPNALPDAPSCERNREPILQVLREHFAGRRRVLEIGSGTGQHAVHFAAAMPWLQWQCSDRAENLSGIDAWLAHAALPNTPPPLELDVAQGPWPAPSFDAAFSANTLHIMGWAEVERFFAGLGRTLAADAVLVVYGPFNYDGKFTSESNRAFDASLKARDPRMGIRDAEAVDVLAAAIGLRLHDDVAMPANNRCRVWRR
jgi:SAM-dependent methyltransferase